MTTVAQRASENTKTRREKETRRLSDTVGLIVKMICDCIDRISSTKDEASVTARVSVDGLWIEEECGMRWHLTGSELRHIEPRLVEALTAKDVGFKVSSGQTFDEESLVDIMLLIKWPEPEIMM